MPPTPNPQSLSRGHLNTLAGASCSQTWTSSCLRQGKVAPFNSASGQAWRVLTIRLRPCSSIMSIRSRGCVVGGGSWVWWNHRSSGRRAPPVSTPPLTTEETEVQKGWLTWRAHSYHFAKLGLESGVLTSSSMPTHSYRKSGNQTLNFCCSVAKSCLTICDPHGLQYTTLPSPSLSPRVCSDSCTLSQWCYLTFSFSIVSFSFRPQSFPASGSFPRSQLFTSGGQSIGASASASVLPMNIQGWFSLGLTGLTSL